MDKHKFFVEKLRFHLKEKDTLVFVGWFFDGSTKDHSLEAYMDGEKLPMELQINRGAQVRQKYIRSINQIDEEVVGIVTLPPDWRERGVFRLRAFYREQETKAYRIRRAGLLRLEQEISYYVESCRRSAGRVTVSGWCMADGEVKLDLLNAARQPISEKVEHYCRRDLLSVFPEYDGVGEARVFDFGEGGRAGKQDRFFLRCAMQAGCLGQGCISGRMEHVVNICLKRRGMLHAISGATGCPQRFIRCRASF